MTLGEFEQFCLRYQDGMFSVAHHILIHVQDAEDAVIETFTRIYRVYSKLTFGSEHEAHIYALLAAEGAAHALLHRIQAHWQYKTEPLELQIDFESIEFKMIPCQSAQDVLTQLLEQLPKQARTILRLRAMGLSFEEIAATLGIDVAYTHTLAHQARTWIIGVLSKGGYQLE